MRKRLRKSNIAMSINIQNHIALIRIAAEIKFEKRKKSLRKARRGKRSFQSIIAAIRSFMSYMPGALPLRNAAPLIAP